MAMALMLAVTRNIPAGLAQMQSGRLGGLVANGQSGHTHQRQAPGGFWGWGESGRPVARRAQGFRHADTLSQPPPPAPPKWKAR